MRYLSTRGGASMVGFDDAVLAGLAPDGGLYVPESWPRISEPEIENVAAAPFAEIADRVIRPFIGPAIPQGELSAIIGSAWIRFSHPSVTPLVEIEPGHFLLELFHGPTLSFKDVAMQFLGPLMDMLLARRGRRATLVVATSGDTGSAAIEAFSGRERIDIVVLHPEGRVSEIQRRQMTTAPGDNVHNIAVRGTFDDCQALLKAMFAHASFRDAVSLSGVNSINWGRIVAQIVYFFKAASALGAPGRKLAFTVPTGNFGDIFSAYSAMRMGLPIEALHIATNANDILARSLASGRYEIHKVTATTSPSMDIQVASNFERLLFEAGGRDGVAVAQLMGRLAQSGGFDVPPASLSSIRSLFSANAASEIEVEATIADVYSRSGRLIDPHTAVGVAVARKRLKPGTIMVTLATAHPAKFPESVAKAAGISPRLPPYLAELQARAERVTVLDNNQAQIERFIVEKSRAGRKSN